MSYGGEGILVNTWDGLHYYVPMSTCLSLQSQIGVKLHRDHVRKLSSSLSRGAVVEINKGGVTGLLFPTNDCTWRDLISAGGFDNAGENLRYISGHGNPSLLDRGKISDHGTDQSIHVTSTSNDGASLILVIGDGKEELGPYLVCVACTASPR